MYAHQYYHTKFPTKQYSASFTEGCNKYARNCIDGVRDHCSLWWWHSNQSTFQNKFFLLSHAIHTIHTMSDTVCAYKLCKESIEQEKNNNSNLHKTRKFGQRKERKTNSKVTPRKNATPKESILKFLNTLKDRTKVKTPMGWVIVRIHTNKHIRTHLHRHVWNLSYRPLKQDYRHVHVCDMKIWSLVCYGTNDWMEKCCCISADVFNMRATHSFCRHRCCCRRSRRRRRLC